MNHNGNRRMGTFDIAQTSSHCGISKKQMAANCTIERVVAMKKRYATGYDAGFGKVATDDEPPRSG